MGYSIKAVPGKKSVPQWRVQYTSYKKVDWPENTRAKAPKKEWNISKDRWSPLGFNKFMTLEEAKIRARQLNAQGHLKRQEEKIKKIEDAQKKMQKRYDSVLPEEFVEEFELRFVQKRDSQTRFGHRKRSRSYTAWRAAQKMIASVGVEPSEWFYHTTEIYDYFYSQKTSLRYMSSIRKLANLWGFFICKKLCRPFLPIPMPRGYERQRLIEANYEKKEGVARASKSIVPKQLDAIKGALNRENFNWIYLSVWFGLRPQEIDNLKNKDLWKTEILPTGRKILWVFQTKIIALPPEDRWKPIPLIFDEQHFALKIIEDGLFRRPLIKTMRKYLGKGVNLYAGRKGFTDLMMSRDQTLENISVWMGHSTIERTWRNYKDKKRFHAAGF